MNETPQRPGTPGSGYTGPAADAYPTPPPDPYPGPPTPRAMPPQTPPGAGFFRQVRRTGLRRTDPRWIGGVCSGVARHTGWDVSLIRGLLVVCAIFFWFPIGIYALALLILPDERDGKIAAEEALAGRFTIVQAGAGLLLLFAIFNPFPYIVASNAPWYVALGLLACGALAFGLYRATPVQREAFRPDQTPPPSPYATPASKGASPMSSETPTPPPAQGPNPYSPGAGNQGPSAYGGRGPAYGPAFRARPSTVPQNGPMPNGPMPPRPSYPAAAYPPPPYQPAPMPPAPYPSAAPASPVMSSRVSMLVLGGISLLAGFFLLLLAIYGMDDFDRLFVLGSAIALGIMGLTLGYQALQGRRGGWFFGLSIAAAAILFPTAMAIGDSWQYQTSFSSGTVEDQPTVYFSEEDCGVACISVYGDILETDHRYTEIYAVSGSTLTVDLTNAPDGMVQDLDLTIEDSTATIIVRSNQAIQLSAEAGYSDLNFVGRDENIMWFGDNLSGDFDKTASNTPYLEDTGQSRFDIDLEATGSIVTIKVLDTPGQAVTPSPGQDGQPMSGQGTSGTNNDTAQSGE